MKINRLILSLLACAALVASCDEKEEDCLIPTLEISATELSVGEAATSETVTITSNRHWEVTTDADWIEQMPFTGEATDVHELSLPVSITEPLGNETLVFITLGEKEWVSRMLNPRPLAAGETIKLSFDLSQAHLFSAETGKTLRS